MRCHSVGSQDRARIVFDRRWRIVRPQSTRKAQMKTILMLIVGLMLAGCGSMENHVRHHGLASTARPPSPDPGTTLEADAICAVPGLSPPDTGPTISRLPASLAA